MRRWRDHSRTYAVGWIEDIAPVRTLGAILALISGLGALNEQRHPWLAGSTFDSTRNGGVW